MIAPVTINPKPQNDKPRLFIAIFGSLGGLIFIFGMLAERYSGVISLLGMLLIVAAIAISVRYIMSYFVYEITDADGEWLFVVSQYSGKRYITLCRVGLRYVVSIEKQSAKNKKSKDLEYTRYAYIPTMMPESYYVMTVISRYEKAKISLQLTDAMAEQLRLYAAEARELYVEEE